MSAPVVRELPALCPGLATSRRGVDSRSRATHPVRPRGRCRMTNSNGNSNGPTNDPRATADAVAKVRTAVAGLAREVEGMRRAMRQVATATELARLAEVVTELSETTATTTGRAPKSDPVPSWLVL